MFELWWVDYAKDKGYDQMDEAIAECCKQAADDAWHVAVRTVE